MNVLVSIEEIYGYKFLALTAIFMIMIALACCVDE